MKQILIGTLIVATLFMFSASNVLAEGPCTADFDCDLDVDATDVGVFLSQFGREQYYDPCPDCYDSPCPCNPAGSVPKTRQTTSYATGDDGDLEKGVEWPDPRFTDNTNGTITDNLTNLTWLKDANCFSTRTWNNALSDCNGLASGTCGISDGSHAGEWRLPNVKELTSLIDYKYTNPALCNTDGTAKWSEGDPFTNVVSYIYHTSSTYNLDTNEGWEVAIADGGVVRGSKSYTLSVWCVKDTFPRFTDNGDGTVTDNQTGLMWYKNANPTAGDVTYAAAEAFCNTSTLAGHSDWRMSTEADVWTLCDDTGSGTSTFTTDAFDITVPPLAWWSARCYNCYTTNPLHMGQCDEGGGSCSGVCASVWPVRGP